MQGGINRNTTDVNSGGHGADQIDGHGDHGCVDAQIGDGVGISADVFATEKRHQRRYRVYQHPDQIRSVIAFPDAVGHHIVVLGIHQQIFQHGQEVVDERDQQGHAADHQECLSVQHRSGHDIGEGQHQQRRAVDGRGQQDHQRKTPVFALDLQGEGGEDHGHRDKLADTVVHPGKIVRGSHEQKKADPEIFGIFAEGADDAEHLEYRDEQKEILILRDADGFAQDRQHGKTLILVVAGQIAGDGGEGGRHLAEGVDVGARIRA